MTSTSAIDIILLINRSLLSYAASKQSLCIHNNNECMLIWEINGRGSTLGPSQLLPQSPLHRSTSSTMATRNCRAGPAASYPGDCSYFCSASTLARLQPATGALTCAAASIGLSVFYQSAQKPHSTARLLHVRRTRALDFWLSLSLSDSSRRERHGRRSSESWLAGLLAGLLAGRQACEAVV